jgi:hypothetical protein
LGDQSYIGLIEMLLFFGAFMGFCLWQIITLKLEKRRQDERKPEPRC